MLRIYNFGLILGRRLTFESSAFPAHLLEFCGICPDCIPLQVARLLIVHLHVSITNQRVTSNLQVLASVDMLRKAGERDAAARRGPQRGPQDRANGC